MILYNMVHMTSELIIMNEFDLIYSLKEMSNNFMTQNI